MTTPDDGRTGTRPRLLVLDDWEGRIAAAPAMARLRNVAETVVLDRPLAEVPDEDLTGVHVVLAVRERTRFDAATLGRLPDLDLILQTGSHAYHADADAARSRGIVIALGRGAVANRAGVAELTFGLAIAALRRFPEASRTMGAGEWPLLTGRTLAGLRLGLLGTGRHGARVAVIAEAFGMDVVAWARPGGAAGGSMPRLDLDELLATSDVISIHLKLSDESRGLLDAERLARCKPGAVLVNTARGAIVDEAALVEALRHGPLSAAGLDVFADEPLPAESPLRTLDNVVLTPHVGWTVEEVFDEFAAIAADQLTAYLAGRLHPEDVMDRAAFAVPRRRLGSMASSPR